MWGSIVQRSAQIYPRPEQVPAAAPGGSVLAAPPPQVPASSAHRSRSPPGGQAAFQGVLAHEAPAGFSPTGEGTAPLARALLGSQGTSLQCLLQARPAKPGRLGSRVLRPDRGMRCKRRKVGERVDFRGLQRRLSKNRTHTLCQELGRWLLGALVRRGPRAAPTGTVMRGLSLPEAEIWTPGQAQTVALSLGGKRRLLALLRTDLGPSSWFRQGTGSGRNPSAGTCLRPQARALGGGEAAPASQDHLRCDVKEQVIVPPPHLQQQRGLSQHGLLQLA